MLNFQQNKKIIFLGGGLGATILLLLFLILHFNTNEANTLVEDNNEQLFIEETEELGDSEVRSEDPQQQIIVLDLKGAVRNPGVYELQVGSRVHQLIDLAGGFNEEADEGSVNLAAPLEDGMVIYIPKKGEVNENPFIEPINEETESTSKLVNINSATVEELQTLPGIGPSKAAAILAYREEEGPFSNIEDIMKVSGIGEKSFDKLKELITVK
ncbi:helix-hairpin-helix domain-containing protein [Metabacillus malikii]|uniref:Competence protein ComEA n=1 Tax=Metabacillus malikii TaxID=1504265 RepID=A0ABT9ZHW3_9BACI|nr:helix-hairpin-helix domain-containing protein [Metabacillus malikii]MDQ0231570.1 competence protein ComEA [Metabacillus malikii]